ncbi:hypothetical protein B0A48_07505 [Cryoendolithus antarcticus]|uniref:SAP domain-containing protein n=1 Tax=Cryoendolithus antarcticus TaxID=1507870 RepID=A0A1V8T6J1_9PEZI|nr:hypothetical protein B0A48_07505 [Cryoendolithus antarcticus]
MPPSWLAKQKKAELIELGSEAGLRLDDGMRRDEMVEQLDKHLQTNSTRLGGNQTFDSYYGMRRTPFKPRGESIAPVTSDDAGARSVVRARGMRASQVKSEYDDDLPSAPTSRSNALAMATSPTIAASRTPATANIIQRRRSSLPPSPSLVANEIEHVEARAYAGLNDLYSLSGIPETIDWIREACSSLAAVHFVIALQESVFLQRQIVPWMYAFDLPAIQPLGISSQAISVPDVFVLLTPAFWKPTLLWSSTSIFVPLFVSYFFNLTVHTVRRHGARVQVVHNEYDPMTFNIAKLLVSLAVYGGGALQGYVSQDTAATVLGSQYGGLSGLLMGAYVGGITSIWQAVQR